MLYAQSRRNLGFGEKVGEGSGWLVGSVRHREVWTREALQREQAMSAAFYFV